MHHSYDLKPELNDKQTKGKGSLTRERSVLGVANQMFAREKCVGCSKSDVRAREVCLGVANRMFAREKCVGCSKSDVLASYVRLHGYLMMPAWTWNFNFL